MRIAWKIYAEKWHKKSPNPIRLGQKYGKDYSCQISEITPSNLGYTIIREA